MIREPINVSSNATQYESLKGHFYVQDNDTQKDLSDFSAGSTVADAVRRKRALDVWSDRRG